MAGFKKRIHDLDDFGSLGGKYLVVDPTSGDAERVLDTDFRDWVNEEAYTPGGTDVAVADGGTGASTAAAARTNLGATTVGANVFTLANPSAITFLRVNADNTVDALNAASFRTAIGAGTGSGSGDLVAANNLSDLANAATARTNLGLAIGTDVQAYDAELAALAGLTSAADKGIQFTGSGTAATYDLTAAGKALLDDADAAAQRATLSAAVRSQTQDCIAGFIASPSDKSYKLVVKIPHAGTITEATTISVSGTCTATFKVNSTALGGTANSVSSVEQSQSHASTNTFAAGDDIVLTVSSNSSCTDMSFSLKYTRVYE